ncbi:hypothetical protein [Scytonema sp. PCC 10023]|uniref:hypothetical protein n=1 Tax=Scytonema sp. PCC 10023 TaxID=1680591 RepID=UPI0039C6CC5A
MTTTTPNRTTDSTSHAPAPYTGFDRLFIGGRWVTGKTFFIWKSLITGFDVRAEFGCCHECASMASDRP